MRTLALFTPGLVLCLSGVVTACTTTDDQADPASTRDDSDSAAAPPPAASDPNSAPAATKITIKTMEPFKLVAYREVTDPVWHLANEQTTGLFTARVRGPYLVTAVCQAQEIGSTQLFTQVWRAGRTLDDAHEVDPPFLCAPLAAQPLPEVTGSLAQTNFGTATVALSGDPFCNSFTDVFNELIFSLLVPAGTYTMYGFNTEKIEIRPNLVVNHSLAVFPFDLTIDGTPYVSAPFFAANADPAAFVHAVTRIEDANGRSPFQLADLPLPGAVVPNEAMTTDNQTVSMQTDVFTGIENVFRDDNLASRRPWRLGDDPAFVEPPQITNGAWAFDGFGQLFASWQALPPGLANFSAEVSGFSLFGDFVDDFTDLSPAFLAQVHPTRAVIDTNIPNFDDAWAIDYHSRFFGSYNRTLTAQRIANPTLPEHGEIATSDIIETVLTNGQLASRAAVDALPPLPHRTRGPETAPYAP